MIPITTYEDLVYVLSGINTLDRWAMFSSTVESSAIVQDQFGQQCLNSMLSGLTIDRGLTERQVLILENMATRHADEIKLRDYQLSTTLTNRLPVRIIDHSRGVYIKNDQIHFKSKYNEQLVAALRAAGKERKGAVTWDADTRIWKMAITEYTVSLAVALAAAYDVPVEPEIMDMFSLIGEVESTKYSIELTLSDDGVKVENAAESMQEWLTHRGADGDLLKLVDYSSVLKYSVSDEIKRAVTSEMGSRFYKFCTQTQIECPITGITVEQRRAKLDDIFAWAKAVDRYPIVVYNPTTATQNHEFDCYFDPSEIQWIDKNPVGPVEFKQGVKLVYANSSFTNDDHIPLLISRVNLLFGKFGRELLDRTEKVVWDCVMLSKQKGINERSQNRNTQ